MPEKIAVINEFRIVEIHSWGEVTKEGIAGAITRAQELFREEHIGKVLVDATRQTTLPSITELHQIFSLLPPNFRVALLIEESQGTASDNRFIETVCLNRGVFIKIFHERQQATCWLNRVHS